MVPEEGFFVAKLMCSMRIDFGIAKEQQIKMISKAINEDYFTEVKTRFKPLAKRVQSKKGYTE